MGPMVYLGLLLLLPLVVRSYRVLKPSTPWREAANAGVLGLIPGALAGITLFVLSGWLVGSTSIGTLGWLEQLKARMDLHPVLPWVVTCWGVVALWILGLRLAGTQGPAKAWGGQR